MKVFVTLLVALLIGATSGIAWAQPGIAPPLPDHLGVYTSEDCASDNVDIVGSMTTIYCVLTGTSELNVSGFEFNLTPATSPSFIFAGATIPFPDVVNIATPPEFLVGLSNPVPPGAFNELTLASLDYFILDSLPVYLYLEPISSRTPSIPGSMAYITNYSDAIPMYPVSGDHANPVFGFNTGPVWWLGLGEISIQTDPPTFPSYPMWELVDPYGDPLLGYGTDWLFEQYPGEYSLTWLEIPEWTTPTPNPVNFLLEAEGLAEVSGFYLPLPQILAVDDVPNDQGRQVRLTWQRCPYDIVDGEYTILEYGVYRQHPAGSSGKLGGWDYVGSAPARTDLEYQMVIPTLCDSTIAEGLCETTFMISAMTSDPAVFWDSQPGTGYSVDNLKPITPTGFKVAFSSDLNELAWDAPVDTDVDHYLVYRTNSVSTPPEAADPPLAQVHGTTYDDTGGWGYVYWLVAVDPSGNRSDLTNWSEAEISGVGDSSLPQRVALYPAAPNPFNPATTISFDLPRDQHVRLAVYSIDGHLVTELVNEVRGAGTNHCLWRGTNHAGQRVASGTYVYRMETEGFTDSGRLMLLK